MTELRRKMIRAMDLRNLSNNTKRAYLKGRMQLYLEIPKGLARPPNLLAFVAA